MNSETDKREPEYTETTEETESQEPSLTNWRPTSDTVLSIQGTSKVQEESEWIDRGIQDVSISKIDLDSIAHVNGPQDFHKVSYNDVVEGFDKLETVVRPMVKEGAGGDDFYKLDQQQGLSYSDGYQKVYDAFWGGDAIRLEKDDENHQVINGAHRLYVAKQLGIQTVPVRLIERRKK